MKILLTLLLCFCTISGFTKTMAGKVVAVEGKATVAPKGKKNRKLARGSVIFTDEMIHVEGASKLQVRFTDGSLINLIPNTKYQINAYSYTNQTSSNQYIGQVFTGGFRHITGDIAKTNPDKVQVKTPTATIGVRGTSFEVLVTPNQGTIVGCELGQINLSTPTGSIALGPSAPFQFSTVSSPGARPEGLTARPPHFSEALFSSPSQGVPTTSQGHLGTAPAVRVKGGC